MLPFKSFLAAFVSTSTMRHVAKLPMLQRVTTSASAFDVDERMLRKFGAKKSTAISIDRSGLFQIEPHSHDIAQTKEPETPMVKHLRALIQFRGGPITVAEYMSEVLTNPTAGYYTQRNVFGSAGDFITSPEVSQLFGEMVGIWCVWMWQELGRPRQLRLVELGPGRGTLMADLLRSTAAFPDFARSVSVELVEVSDALKERQMSSLGCSTSAAEASADSSTFHSSLSGAEVRWHRSLDDVRGESPALYIAHEFFDALPVHHFQRTSRGWRERLVDASQDPTDPLHLRLVLAPNETPASKLLLPPRLAGLTPADRDSLDLLEVCPQGLGLAGELAKRVTAEGGAALVIDYGHDQPYADSLQAIKDHSFVPVLSQPGLADLSAHVDFSAIKHSVNTAEGSNASCHGPITQAHFLEALGIRERLEGLLQTASQEEGEQLISGYYRLVSSSSDDADSQRETAQPGEADAIRGEDGSDPLTQAAREEGMGITYKVLAITPQSSSSPIPF
ncbi:g2508 [Coccomyxa viridis]|uniref:Protein arginine methyltransferase NDUFAF7 n=1 Tax=Coccomyxa viridis TaxID=1274662 RepID=A0ABP1FSN1_9CHLO